MSARHVTLVAVLMSCFPHLEAIQPTRLVAATNSYVLASSANVQGLFGAYFKTRVVLVNPNLSAMRIQIKAATPSGPLSPKTVALAPGEVRVSTNVLDEVFQYTGGAALLFQTDPDSVDSLAPFLLTAEVYVEGPSGRTSTPLQVLGSEDRVASSEDVGSSLSPGVVIDANNRASVGCVNFDPSPATITASLPASPGPGGATTPWSNTFSLQPQQWQQVSVGLTSAPSGSTVSFRSSGPTQYLYCYAVNVNNGSNDGTQIPAIYVVPSVLAGGD